MRNHNRANEAPLPEPLAYFLTWHTYGTWLPGDERGWVERGHGHQLPSLAKRVGALRRMTDNARVLSQRQRKVIESTIACHCAIRNWTLHAVNCRTNHVHVVVTASAHPELVRNQFKSYCTRALNSLARARENVPDSERRSAKAAWWAERGSERYLNDERSLEAAILYVREAQDKPRY
jgi:REP element-mobilizing transposase RayT